jgi:hypothetical protein
MQKFFEDLGWKKVAIILVVISILFLVFVVISFKQPTNESTSTNQNQSDNNPTSAPNVTSSPNAASPVPSSAAPKQKWQSYKGLKFSINYPVGFTSAETPISNTGRSVVFSLPGGSVQVYVEYDSAGVTSVAKLASVFNTLNYSSTVVNIAGQSALKYSGSTPSGATSKSYDTAYIFQKNDIVYKLQLTYERDNSTIYYEDWDKTFDSMVSSFSLR